MIRSWFTAAAALCAFACQPALARGEQPSTLALSSFGAVGDNVADDTAPLQRAFSAASGRCLDGEGRTYRVRGTLRVASDFCLTNTRLRQDPEGFDTQPWIRGDCPVEPDPAAIISCGDPPISEDMLRGLSAYLFARTLLIRPESSSAKIAVTLRKVSVDRGNDPASGARSDAAGIWIGNARQVDLDEVEVTGAGKGFGVIIVESMNVTARQLWIHDMVWAPYVGDAPLMLESVRKQGWNTAPIREFRLAGQGAEVSGFYGMRVQEQLTCLMILNSQFVLLDRPRIEGCRARFAEGDIPWQADGIAIGQSSTQIQVIKPTISDTWEGIDVVGGGTGVSDVVISGARISNSFGYGVKWGYVLDGMHLVDSTISQSGLAGVVIYGPVNGADLRRVKIDSIGSVRFGMTVQRPWQQERAGVLVEPGGSAETRDAYPSGVSLVSVRVRGGKDCRFGLLNLTPQKLRRADIRATGCERAYQYMLP